MKRLLTFVITMFLGASLALAQTTGDKASKTALNPQPLPPGKVMTATSTKSTSGKKGHKSGKKGKKSSGAATTPAPK